jgi:hypothetical protein
VLEVTSRKLGFNLSSLPTVLDLTKYGRLGPLQDSLLNCNLARIGADPWLGFRVVLRWFEIGSPPCDGDSGIILDCCGEVECKEVPLLQCSWGHSMASEWNMIDNHGLVSSIVIFLAKMHFGSRHNSTPASKLLARVGLMLGRSTSHCSLLTPN